MGNGVKGYKWDLKLAAETVPETLQTVGKASDVDLDRDGDTLDTSTRDGAGWKGKEQGLKEWKCSIQHLWVPANAAYVLLENAYNNGTKLICQFSEAAPADGVKGYDGLAVVKKMGIPQKLKDAVFVAVELEGDGALTPVTRDDP